MRPKKYQNTFVEDLKRNVLRKFRGSLFIDNLCNVSPLTWFDGPEKEDSKQP